jgi:hypothetical protein
MSKIAMCRIQKILFFVLVIFISGCAHTQNYAPTAPVQSVSVSLTPLFDQLVTDLIKEAPSLVNLKIAVGELTELSGHKTQREAFLEEKLIESLSRVGTVPLVERTKLDTVLQELNFNMSGYIDEESEKLLGKVLGADGLIMGTITELGETLELVVRVIRTETGEILAVGAVEIPNDPQMKQLNSQLLLSPDTHYRPPLAITMNLVAQRKAKTGQYQDVLVHEGAVLHSGDNLQVHFSANANCYVYLLLLNASGKAMQLFPDEKIAISNQVNAQQEYHLPPDNFWFYLDDQIGTETIYLLASYKPMTHLASILSKMGTEGEGSETAPANQLKEGVDLVMRGRGKKPQKPIRITGTLGRQSDPEPTMRGFEGIRQGPPQTFKLSNGQTIQKATEIIQGYASVVRIIHFEHRE